MIFMEEQWQLPPIKRSKMWPHTPGRLQKNDLMLTPKDRLIKRRRICQHIQHGCLCHQGQREVL